MAEHFISISTKEVSDGLLAYCSDVLKDTIQDKQREQSLADLALLSSSLEQFVHGLCRVDIPNFSSDDEILNWTFADTTTDLWGSIWLLASGFYKLSASSLRNALDIGVAALYFQVRENTDPIPGGYNKFYQEWDIGSRETPSWREMKPFISKQPTVKLFDQINQTDAIGDIHKHFKYLCAYTHTSSYANNGDAVTAKNSTGIQPIFDQVAFERGVSLSIKTMSFIATAWQVTFPEILKTEPLGPRSSSSYDQLFCTPLGKLALQHQ